MSKEFPQFNEDEQGKADGSVKAKRSTAPRAKKAVLARKSKNADEIKPKVAEVVKAPVAGAKVPVVKKDVPSAPEPEWSETVPESVGGATPGGEGGNKRKRRRRKGKGGGSSATVEVAEAPPASLVGSPAASTPQPQVAKSRMNPELLAKSAWKIYLAEVSEEGVALVGDQDARELARRCFRLAEIFMEEQSRRVGGL